ncbi:MAG: hypothetical protein ACRCV0_05925 [Brevinema sp.]
MQYFYLLLFLCFKTFIFSQEFNFLGIRLGMTSEEILEVIKDSKDIIPSEDILLKQLIYPTPVTLVLKGNNTNNNVIQKIHIDIYQNTNYQITIFLNKEYFSFYTLSEKLLDKYGVATERSSQRVIWFLNQEKTNKLSLEYPSIIKIVNTSILNQVSELQNQNIEQNISESINYKNRQRILDEL